MNDFEGLLSSDYGFKPSGKSAPMAAAPRSTSATTNSTSAPFNFDIPRSKTSSSNITSPSYDFSNLGGFDDVFSTSKSSTGNNNRDHSFQSSSANFDSIFVGGCSVGGGSEEVPPPRFSSMPVFDKPVYDDELSSSPLNRVDNIFTAKKSSGGDAFDDLLGGLGKKEPLSVKSTAKGSDKGVSGFDDLLPGFGGGSAPINRSSSGTTKKSPGMLDDPFVISESTSPPVSSSSVVYSDPSEEIGNLNNSSGRKKFENYSSGGVFDDIDPLGGFVECVPPFSVERNSREKDETPLKAGSRVSGRQTSAGADAGQKSSVTSTEREYGESQPSFFEIPSVSAEFNKSVPNSSSPVHGSSSFGESNTHGHVYVAPEETMGAFDEVWLSVSEVPLFTQLTAAPPPSRSPPPRPAQFSRAESGSYPTNAQSKNFEYPSFPGSSQYFQSSKSAPVGAAESFPSPLDDMDEFAMSRNQSSADEHLDARSGEDIDTNSVAAASAAAMKEAMDRAEAKFKYAKGLRERENAKVSRSPESVPADKKENTNDVQDREFREGQERLMLERQRRERDEEERRHREEEERRQREEEERRQREEDERRQREEEERRQREKEREDKEREKRRVDRERELARHAVERAAREARERAAIEARTRAERVAVQKAQAEVRERAERAAVQRAQAEARERAAAVAKERADKAAAEAREKARSEAREKDAQEKAAAARASEQKNEPDFDSIFGYNSRASSAPRPSATSSDSFEAQFQAKPTFEATRNSVNSTSSMRKASSSTNIVDDLSSIFGGPQPAGVFQDVEGETEDRRRARLERHQRTQERAAKALAEKNARDLEAQREQTERHRIGETLDVEIKRWAAGKEGNLRALLSTLQYVLWPECGWQPVSLTDLITGAAVKKVYRKATLCIHPDKVQQKGATLQQKYVAEKVFDLLKEAWNKFNSEELF